MTCKDCIHSGLCYKENDYDNFPDRCGDFISDKVLEERPKGEWIKEKVAFYLECPFCGCDIRDANTCFLTDEDALNFCPNCGADMRGEEE